MTVRMMGKEVNSSNKNRLQSFCINLDKHLHSNDFEYLNDHLRVLPQLLSQRREADLHIMRQLKYLPLFMEIIKKVYNCPKHEKQKLNQNISWVMKSIEIFSGIPDNRTYMMVSNRLIPLVDLGKIYLSKSLKTIIQEYQSIPSLLHILTIHIRHRMPPHQLYFRELFIEYLFTSGILSKI